VSNIKVRDLIIIGAGPAGLKAAEEAEKRGLKYQVLERNRIGQSWRDFRPQLQLLSPSLPQRDWTSISPRFPIWKLPVDRPYCKAWQFVEYMEQFHDHFQLNILEHTAAEEVSYRDGSFWIADSDGNTWQTSNLLVATGIISGMFFPDVPGIKDNPLVLHSQEYKGTHNFLGKRVLIIGSGNSAAETAIDLAGKAMVYLYTRGEIRYFSETKKLFHVRGISESYLKELIAMEIIRHKVFQQLQEIRGNKAVFKNSELVVNNIIFATGYKPYLPFLKGLDIEHNGAGYPKITKTGESVNYPGLFFAGPLAQLNSSSALIHGFSRQVELTIDQIEEQNNNRVVVPETELQQGPINLIL